MALPQRKKTLRVDVGGVPVGGGAPIAVQSMTDTDTADAEKTAAQILRLVRTGSEIVRITVNTPQAASKVAEIKRRLEDAGCFAPLVGDFHYNGDRLLRERPDCAEALAKYRINPGNVSKGAKGDDKFRFMVETAIERGKPIRIGVNWGSLDPEVLSRMMDDNAASPHPLGFAALRRKALAASALESAQKAVEIGLPPERIVLSCKVSAPQELIDVYGELSSRCDYPLHLGLTEAGMGVKGIVASSAALAVLLQQGIGDTIRVSLTPGPGEDRTGEVKVCRALLQSLGLRAFSPTVASCPGCGRTSGEFFRVLAQSVQKSLDEKMAVWRETCPGAENMSVAVMGCVVNGPGESKLADVGVSLPGAGEQPVAPVYVAGEHFATLKGDAIAPGFIRIVERYALCAYGRGSGDEEMEKFVQAARGKAAAREKRAALAIPIQAVRPD